MPVGTPAVVYSAQFPEASHRFGFFFFSHRQLTDSNFLPMSAAGHFSEQANPGITEQGLELTTFADERKDIKTNENINNDIFFNISTLLFKVLTSAPSVSFQENNPSLVTL